VLPAVPSGYRQCPEISQVGVLPTAQQFAFPNHGWVQYCSDGGPPGLFAGTDLAQAIHDGAKKMTDIAQSFEPKTLVLIADGVPMACTGIGGGGLCGHTYGGDKVPPPPGMTSADFWNPCCANGLTCGANTSHNGYTFGGGDWGDGTPSNSPNGQAACDAAHTLVGNAMDEADKAAAAGVNIFVIGFFRNPDPLGISETFLMSLVRGPNSSGTITSDAASIAGLLQKIPQRVPVVLAR
jgi:hypothetical protein